MTLFKKQKLKKSEEKSGHIDDGHNGDVNPIKYIEAKNQGRVEERTVGNYDKSSYSINMKAETY